jgi:Arc/MetJ-type ribon-helix-helix transcriptional regulator
MKRRRVQIDLTERSYQLMKDLRGRGDCQSNAEVVRKALKLYAWYLKNKDSLYTTDLLL